MHSSPSGNADTPLLIDKKLEYWLLTLNQPAKRNALSASLVEALLKALQAAESHEIPLLVLQGSGKSFCAGFDLSEIDQSSDADLLLRFVRLETLLQRIHHSPCTTLALAHGANAGAGADLVASCHYRIADPGASFFLPGLKFELALGTNRLKKLIGGQKTLELLQQTRAFKADEACDINFVNQVVAQAKWPTVINQYVKIATALPVASRHHLYSTVVDDTRSTDMSRLVLSASKPGLKQRILQFIHQKQ